MFLIIFQATLATSLWTFSTDENSIPIFWVWIWNCKLLDSPWSDWQPSMSGKFYLFIIKHIFKEIKLISRNFFLQFGHWQHLEPWWSRQPFGYFGLSLPSALCFGFYVFWRILFLLTWCYEHRIWIFFGFLIQQFPLFTNAHHQIPHW